MQGESVLYAALFLLRALFRESEMLGIGEGHDSGGGGGRGRRKKCLFFFSFKGLYGIEEICGTD